MWWWAGGQLYASLEQLLHHEEALTEDRRLLMLDMASLVREILQDDPGIDPQVFAALQPEYVVSEPPACLHIDTAV